MAVSKAELVALTRRVNLWPKAHLEVEDYGPGFSVVSIHTRGKNVVGHTLFQGSAEQCGAWLLGFLSATTIPGRAASDKQAEAAMRERAGKNPTAANPVWTQKYKDSLPDTAFLIVDKACATSKRGGRSHPLSCRHLPYKDKAGRVNKGHLKAAIGRAPQTTSVPVAMRKAAQAKARKLYAKLYG